MARSIESQGRSFDIDGRAVDPVPLAVIDSFEDGNITSDPAWGGDTGDFSTAENPSYGAIDGSWVLENDTTNSTIHLDSTGFSKGNIAHIYFYASSTDDGSQIRFGRQDSSNYYEININTQDSSQINKVVDGSQTNLATQTGFGWDGSTWYRFEVLWNDGNIDPANNDNWNSSTTSLGADGDIGWGVFNGVSGPDDGTEEGNSPLTTNDTTSALQDNDGVSWRCLTGDTTHTTEFWNVPTA